MRNYEFDINEESNLIILHMMDRVEKYLSRICNMNTGELPMVQIQGPEGLPQDMLAMIEQTISNRFAMHYKPKEELSGVISVKVHDPYTLIFDISKLWFEQKIEDVQIQIIDLMGIEEEYVDIDWAKNQLLDDPEDLDGFDF
jgi:hypothetical protein